jgi:4-carboxymuconolactone decarboxylase
MFKALVNATVLAAPAMAATAADTMEAQREPVSISILRAGSQPSIAGSAENFTGKVRIDSRFQRDEPARAGATVTFEPAARTAWHVHPLGQTLIVTSGTGWVGQLGGPAQEIKQGDVVWIPPGVKHWHGATATDGMTHIAISEQQDGTAVQWMEKVTHDQYNAAARKQPNAQRQSTSRPSGEVQQRSAPGLAALTDEVLFGDVWRRPELSPRDRSLVTVSVLIATGKPAQLAGHLGRALDNGVKPTEASGLLAHLAIYCGWPSAVSALDVYEQVYAARKVDTTALRAPGPRLPASSSNTARARALNEELGAFAPKFVQLTNDVVFDHLWRSSDLALRDRYLVTIAALAAMGDHDHLGFYLRHGIESGLTRAQITEAMTHLGFYAGWAKATQAIVAITATRGP